MTELIRYAGGQSSMGDFLAVTSDRGLVAFEFATRGEHAVEDLQARLPGTQVHLDQAGLRATIHMLAQVVEHPDRNPGVALDPRGTGFEKQVWALLRNIPAGRTSHYGAIAAQMGMARDARDVTKAIAANKIAILTPCHRVIKKDGSISGFRCGVCRKRALLARERDSAGTRFEPKARA